MLRKTLLGLGMALAALPALAQVPASLPAGPQVRIAAVTQPLPTQPQYSQVDVPILRDRVQATGKDEAAVSAAMLASVPAGRFAEAHEVAAAIAFLATPAAGYVNGVSLAVDGGRMQSI